MIKFATNFFHFATWSLLPVAEVPLPNFHNFKIDWSYFCFHFRDLTSWINGIMALVTSDELAKDVASAEALLDRHQVRRVKTLYPYFQTKEVFRNSPQFVDQSNDWLREQSTFLLHWDYDIQIERTMTRKANWTSDIPWSLDMLLWKCCVSVFSSK